MNTRTLTALFAALALSGSACDATNPAPPAAQAPAPADPAAETLALVAAPSVADRVQVDLVYSRRAEQAAPRMMELWVDVGAGLAYAGAEPLAAALAAGKELVVQGQGPRLRVVLYASGNTATLDSGPLARLAFRKVTGGPETLTLVPELPIFAPAPANDGLLLGAPLDLATPPTSGGTP